MPQQEAVAGRADHGLVEAQLQEGVRATRHAVGLEHDGLSQDLRGADVQADREVVGQRPGVHVAVVRPDRRRRLRNKPGVATTSPRRTSCWLDAASR